MTQCRVTQDLNNYLSKQEEMGHIQDFIENYISEHFEEGLLETLNDKLTFPYGFLIEALEDDEDAEKEFQSLMLDLLNKKSNDDSIYRLGMFVFKAGYDLIKKHALMNLEDKAEKELELIRQQVNI